LGDAADALKELWRGAMYGASVQPFCVGELRKNFWWNENETTYFCKIKLNQDYRAPLTIVTVDKPQLVLSHRKMYFRCRD
jgi:hypothetical protein